MLSAILDVVKDGERKTVGFQVLAMNLLCLKRGTKCSQKRPCAEVHGFCNFAVFVDQKSRAPERVKRDPHDLVLFLHPKQCLTCGREKFALLLVLETVPSTFFLVVFLTSNGGLIFM